MTEELYHPQDLTWQYLRTYYYPRFRAAVQVIDWDVRYEVLRVLYDHGSETPWEVRSDNPVGDMMGWVARKGYWSFFLRGATVGEDGSFRLHCRLSEMLGISGALGDPEGDAPEDDMEDDEGALGGMSEGVGE